MANWNDKFESKFLKKIKLDEINELRFNLEKNLLPYRGFGDNF